jgi:hypothetical protein
MWLEGFLFSAGIAIEMTKWERSRALIIDVMTTVRASFKTVLKATINPKE